MTQTTKTHQTGFAGLVSRCLSLTALAAFSGFLFAALGALGAPSERRGQFFPDQQNLVPMSASWSARHLAPMGQEVVPTSNSLNAVQLMVANRDTVLPRPNRLQVNIRDGAITGTLLATSLPLAIPFGFEGVAHFAFPASVPLTPGRTLVLEIVVLDPNGGNIAVGGGSGTYTAGRAIIQGVPVPSTSRDCLWFREGTQQGGAR